MTKELNQLLFQNVSYCLGSFFPLITDQIAALKYMKNLDTSRICFLFGYIFKIGSSARFRFDQL